MGRNPVPESISEENPGIRKLVLTCSAKIDGVLQSVNLLTSPTIRLPSPVIFSKLITIANKQTTDKQTKQKSQRDEYIFLDCRLCIFRAQIIYCQRADYEQEPQADYIFLERRLYILEGRL